MLIYQRVSLARYKVVLPSEVMLSLLVYSPHWLYIYSLYTTNLVSLPVKSYKPTGLTVGHRIVDGWLGSCVLQGVVNSGQQLGKTTAWYPSCCGSWSSHLPWLPKPHPSSKAGVILSPGGSTVRPAALHGCGGFRVSWLIELGLSGMLLLNFYGEIMRIPILKWQIIYKWDQVSNCKLVDSSGAAIVSTEWVISCSSMDWCTFFASRVQPSLHVWAPPELDKIGEWPVHFPQVEASPGYKLVLFHPYNYCR